MKYSKKPFTIDDHINILKERKLIISSEERAIKYLNSIGYFRITGYMYHLQNSTTNEFRDGVTFDSIINLYKFDKKLRAIIIEYLERIEVALRAKMTNQYSLEYGFFWYRDDSLYADKDTHELINGEIEKSFENPQENFLRSFKFKYTSETHPPSNMALEILTLGKLSRLFKGLNNDQIKSNISSEFNLPPTTLSSWFIYLTNVRNVCAHHSRLWNKKITADRPSIPTRQKFKFHGEITDDFNTTMYGIISMIYRLLNSFNKENMFIEKIEALIEEYSVDTSLMGFPEKWKKTATWHN